MLQLRSPGFQVRTHVTVPGKRSDMYNLQNIGPLQTRVPGRGNRGRSAFRLIQRQTNQDLSELGEMKNVHLPHENSMGWVSKSKQLYCSLEFR